MTPSEIEAQSINKEKKEKGQKSNLISALMLKENWTNYKRCQVQRPESTLFVDHFCSTRG